MNAAIHFPCTQCGSNIAVPEEQAGKLAICSNCQSMNSIPESGYTVATNQNLYDTPVKEAYQHPHAYGGQYLAPHRGGLILGLGIASLLCNIMFIPGILAWILGRSDLQQIRAGHMDRSGEGTTQAGMVIGIIMTCLQLGVILLYVLFVMVMIIVGIASGV